uniref:Uncharacterized protein n=1 Tax=Plectus sambesii TaxID=2011161 RepID=A0A914V0E1_9BILA
MPGAPARLFDPFGELRGVNAVGVALHVCRAATGVRSLMSLRRLRSSASSVPAECQPSTVGMSAFVPLRDLFALSLGGYNFGESLHAVLLSHRFPPSPTLPILSTLAISSIFVRIESVSSSSSSIE